MHEAFMWCWRVLFSFAACIRTQLSSQTSFALPTMVAAAVPADLAKRLGKRLRSILVVQSQAPLCFCGALSILGADVPTLVPPNAFDLSMSCRRWRWLMRSYDVSLKVFFVERANALLTFAQPADNDPAFEQGGVFPETT